MQTMRTDIFDEYRRLREQNVVLSFKGMLSQNILAGLVEIIKEKYSLEPAPGKVAKKMYPIFVEMAQNVIHHSAEKIEIEDNKRNIGLGIILLSEKKDHYVITTGNLTENRKITGIKKLLDTVNGMEKDDVRQLYRQKLRSRKEVGEAESGIALVNIMRKADNSVSYDINSIDQRYSFLVLSAKIRKKGES
ncbi:MAG: hypothetical protein GY950_02640 [bacterium]|nr:hypothetical protein [bacterium]